MSNDQQRIDAARVFEEWYGTLQAQFPNVCLTPSAETSALVTLETKPTEPIHRWYSLKEAFSPNLPIWVTERLQNRFKHRPQEVLDPFLGGGTTGVVLGSQGINVKGVEYSPFIRSIAAAKASVTEVLPCDLERAIRGVLATPIPDSTEELPKLTTLHDEKYCNPDEIRLLRTINRRIMEFDGTPAVRRLLQCGVAATVEGLFQLRKDGRALRYTPKDRQPVVVQLKQNWQAILEDVSTYNRTAGLEPVRPLFEIYAGSALSLTAVKRLDETDSPLADSSVDTILYSPPYLNNFDYSEIYKLELWVLDFITSYDEWRTLRLGTIRSHFSVKFPETSYLARDPRTAHIAPTLAAMAASICIPDKERREVAGAIQGYFDDMYCALCEQYRVLKPGGMLVYVVANSRHYYLPIATDVILAEIARAIGFTLQDLVVLKHRNGRTRQKSYLHESAVFIQKPR